jgi:hypothetical protein
MGLDSSTGDFLSIQYKIEPSANMVVITTRGNVTMADRYEFTDQLAMDEALPVNVNALVDVRKEEQAPTEVEIRWIVILLVEVRKNYARRVAFLTLPENKSYELISAFAGDTVGGVQAFSNEKEARKWLNCKVPAKIL